MEQGDTQDQSPNSSVEERLEKKLDKIAARSDGATEAEPQPVEKPAITTDANSSGRGEVSAAAMARMMGLATATEVGLLEGKIDLLSSRINSITLRMEKVLGALNKLPQAADMDRIDVNIGSLKTMIRETLDKASVLAEMDNKGTTSLSNVKIMSSEDSAEQSEDTEQS